MSRALVVTLFLLVAGSIATLIKWEYKRFQRRQPSESKAFQHSVAVSLPVDPFVGPAERHCIGRQNRRPKMQILPSSERENAIDNVLFWESVRPSAVSSASWAASRPDIPRQGHASGCGWRAPSVGNHHAGATAEAAQPVATVGAQVRVVAPTAMTPT
jgi:hypothetical protein